MGLTKSKCIGIVYAHTKLYLEEAFICRKNTTLEPLVFIEMRFSIDATSLDYHQTIRSLSALALVLLPIANSSRLPVWHFRLGRDGDRSTHRPLFVDCTRSTRRDRRHRSSADALGLKFCLVDEAVQTMCAVLQVT